MQIDAHKDAVDLFDRYAKRGDNKDLKSFAAKQLGSKRFAGSHKPTVHLCTERTPESVVARCMEHASINHQFIVTERVGPTPVNRVT
jgi:hypothetical protein